MSFESTDAEFTRLVALLAAQEDTAADIALGEVLAAHSHRISEIAEIRVVAACLRIRCAGRSINSSAEGLTSESGLLQPLHDLFLVVPHPAFRELSAMLSGDEKAMDGDLLFAVLACSSIVQSSILRESQMLTSRCATLRLPLSSTYPFFS